MLYCFLLAVLFVALAAFIVHSAYRKRSKGGGQQVAFEIFGAKVNANGFLAAAIAVALGFGLLAYRTLATCDSGADGGASAEVAVAREALRDAEVAEAPKYAAESWKSLEALDRKLKQSIAAQEDRLPFARSWSETVEIAQTLLREAKAARDLAVNGKRRAASDARSKLTEAKSRVGGTTSLLQELAACKRQPKDFKKDLEAIKGTLDGLAAQIAGIESSELSEDYFGALEQAASLIESLRVLAEDMTRAMHLIKCDE